MQTIRPFIRPALIATATAGSLLGYCVVKKYVLPEKNLIPNFGQFAFVVAGIGTPVCFGLSTMPALVTSALISGAGTLFFGNNVKPVPPPTSPPPPPPLSLPDNIKKSVDAFVPVLQFDFNSEDSSNFQQFITSWQDNFNNSNLAPLKKISVIENIFKHFKDNNNGQFKNSEIWTSLLSTLSQQTDIKDTQEITLDVADGRNGKITLSFKQLKGFMDSLKAPRNTDNNLEKLLNNMPKNGVYSKVLHQNNIHYYSFTIHKMDQDKYKILCFDSFLSKNASITQKKTLTQATLEKLIAINTQEKAKESFFTDDMPFTIENNNSDKVIQELYLKQDKKQDKKQDDNFTPFSQASNTCHQIAVMNLFKYYIEKAST